MMLILRSLLVPTICLAICTSSASAFTYQYTGAYYQHVIYPYKKTMKITAKIDVSQEIPPNYQGYVTIQSFKVFDGVNTFNTKNGINFTFYVETDNSGAIEFWNLKVSRLISPEIHKLVSKNEANGNTTDKVIWCVLTACGARAKNIGTPGSWSAGTKQP